MQKVKEFSPTGHDILSVKENRKKIIIFLLVLAIGITTIVIGKKYVFKSESKEIYEVVIMVRDQRSSDPKEDARSSLKSGDVLLVKKDSQKWSQTERVSYLILRMNLNDDEVVKLTESVNKELSEKEVEKEIEQFTANRGDISKEEADRYKEELEQRKEVILLRKYRIEMEKSFPDFKANDLIKGQPFQGEVYDWDIVEKK